MIPPTRKHERRPTAESILKLLLITATAAGIVPAGGRAQVRVRAAAPILIAEPAVQNSDDPYHPVHMLESPNIDRFLRRAQDFLGRDDFRGAIKILQDVIEGRTLADPIAEGETAPGVPDAPDPAGAPGASQAGGAGGSGEGDAWSDLVESAANAVFSDDERLYRPVRRLCHELLAALPPEGITFYRSVFEVRAERELAEAASAGDLHRLEAIYNDWFITLTAARAMATAGDLLMDQGTFRAAIQTYRLLLEVYPADGRRSAGLSDAYLRFRVALCFQRLGDAAKAADELRRLAELHPDESLRLMGELVPVAQLPDSDLFRLNTVDAAAPVAVGDAALRTGHETLVTLWEHRYADQTPYRPSRAAGNRSGVVFVGDGREAMTASPRVSDYIPGTSVQFIGETVAFLDHYRLRINERLSGLMLAEDPDGIDDTPPPQQGTPRSRVPAYDFAAMRVAHDAQRMYVVLGPKVKRLQGMKPVLENSLHAFALGDLEPVWSTHEQSGYKDVTFLATPTVFGTRLLVPVAQRGTFGLQCIDGATGELIFHVHIHREGTAMARPPASPVVVHAGIAYMLTNAGALASVDAYTGSLRWIRRYERMHPFRPKAVRHTRPRTQQVFGGRFFQEIILDGFAPGDMIVHGGLVFFAPSDGRIMLCLDGASGEPVWMLSKDRMEYLLGFDDRHLYVAGVDSIYAIGLRSGVRLWMDEMPDAGGPTHWRGRGTVTNDLMIMPGNRELLLRKFGRDDPWTRVPLPSFSYGHDPLSGPFNIQVDGSYLAAVYQGGVEMYSTIEALNALADASDDLLQRSIYQAQAGELMAAIATLEAIAVGTDERLAAQVPKRMLSLCGEMAVVMATRGARKEALELLDRCRARLTTRRQIERWHLARLEVFKALGDAVAIEREQEALYQVMERG